MKWKGGRQSKNIEKITVTPGDWKESNIREFHQQQEDKAHDSTHLRKRTPVRDQEKTNEDVLRDILVKQLPPVIAPWGIDPGGSTNPRTMRETYPPQKLDTHKPPKLLRK